MAKKCIELADIDEAVSCADLDNLAGVVQSLVYGYWEDVASWPDLPAPSGEAATMSFADAGAWDGDLVMKAGCRAYQLVFTDDSGELTISDQGETGGESCKYELAITRAKMSQVIFGFENATRGRRLFLIVTDKNGNRYLMGDKLNAARKVAADASTTGKVGTDLNKTPLKFDYSCPRKLMYTGDVEKILQVAE
ncbi:hypothetical protein [Bacteroides sp. 41_26]|uniref:hypothetical protein n=1 Tax=Bacteroides sp. 41_26 TaxID=1896973 RepID=UPI00259C99F2|nr:hypothetical protein [Bacteroides sp. 41_26]